jgi:hypothetical protein
MLATYEGTKAVASSQHQVASTTTWAYAAGDNRRQAVTAAFTNNCHSRDPAAEAVRLVSGQDQHARNNGQTRSRLCERVILILLDASGWSSSSAIAITR